MTDFAIAVEISAPAERVWAIMGDIERWPEWTPTVTSVDLLDPGPLAVGQRARIRQPKLPLAVWRITALEPGRSFTWVTRSPGVVVTARHSVEPAPGGSRAHLALHFGGPLGPLVARITRGLNLRYLDLEAAGLRRRSEAPPEGA
ncbi:MAG TPA: SRPBCC family protein [Gemmatimonadales bacterium]|nr:SRPBCC family protein [Gemmatimonadales bacterium]